MASRKRAPRARRRGQQTQTRLQILPLLARGLGDRSDAGSWLWGRLRCFHMARRPLFFLFCLPTHVLLSQRCTVQIQHWFRVVCPYRDRKWKRKRENKSLLASSSRSSPLQKAGPYPFFTYFPHTGKIPRPSHPKRKRNSTQLKALLPPRLQQPFRREPVNPTFIF
jgi:hypothetical protein